MIGFDGGCARFRRDIGLFRDGYLSERRAEKLHAHLTACESCRVARDLAAMAGAELSAAPDVDATPSFNDRVIGALFAGNRTRRANWAQWKNFAFGTAAAGLIMGFALQFAAMPDRGGIGVAQPAGAAQLSPPPDPVPPGQLLDPHNQDPNAPLWRLAPNDKPRGEPVRESSGGGHRFG